MILTNSNHKPGLCVFEKLKFFKCNLTKSSLEYEIDEIQIDLFYLFNSGHISQSNITNISSF